MKFSLEENILCSASAETTGWRAEWKSWYYCEYQCTIHEIKTLKFNPVARRELIFYLDENTYDHNTVDVKTHFNFQLSKNKILYTMIIFYFYYLHVQQNRF